MANRLSKLVALVVSLALPSLLASASLPDGRLNANMLRSPGIPLVPLEEPAAPVISRNGTVLPPYDTVYYFDQLIDHNNPKLGTFKQRYWHTWEFYESGGPIVLMTPGEGNADGYSGYLTNKTINGLIAQQQNASTIVIEHRFYGFSNPYPDLTVNSLRVHNLEQAVNDLVYFAQNVVLPMPGGNQVTPDKAPWILIGGSYSGALTSWTMVNKPGIFWAGYSSSGVVEAILDFWEYFEPIRLNMPANCSADVQAVIAEVDKTFTGKNNTAIQAIKDAFGLGNMTHLDDIAGALRNNLWDWQSLQPTTGPNGQFYRFCDALEVKNGISAPASGWGLNHALAAWSSYFKNIYFSQRESLSSATMIGLIVPRQCQLMFPEAFPTPPTPAIQRTNSVYKGWNVKLDRIFFANGQRDPWKDATVSATRHTVQSTAQQPIFIGDGFHCSDLKTASGQADPTIMAVQVAALGYFKTWLAEWKPNPKPHTPITVNISPAISGNVAVYGSAPKPVNAIFKGVGTN
ncbi:hypothetical protein C0991_007863 [Blastosporella zonata]|nr:hypothetical protein C0991_007863 [Blastosporella zonata]